MSQAKIFDATELNSIVLSHLDPVSLQRTASTSRAMNQLAMDPALWRGFLAEDVRGASVDPRLDVINAITGGRYIELTPECLLNMLYAETIGVDAFDDGLLGALQSKYGNIASQKITMLTSPIMKQLYEDSEIKPRDFKDFSTQQLANISNFSGRNNAEKLFIECNFKPQDIVILNCDQINAIVNSYDVASKFTKYKITTQDLTRFSPHGISFLLDGEYTENIREIIDNPHQKYSRLLANAAPYNFDGLNAEQIVALHSRHSYDYDRYDSTYILYIKCGLIPQDFIMLTAEQISAITEHWRSPSIQITFYFSKIDFQNEIKPKDFSALTIEQIKALGCSTTGALFEEYALNPKDLIKFTPEGIMALSKTKFNSEQLNGFLANPPESLLTPEYLASIKVQEDTEALPHLETLTIGEDDTAAASELE